MQPFIVGVVNQLPQHSPFAAHQIRVPTVNERFGSVLAVLFIDDRQPLISPRRAWWSMRIVLGRTFGSFVVALLLLFFLSWFMAANLRVIFVVQVRL